MRNGVRLTTETVQSASLPLEGIDHIEGGDRLSLGVFGVCDSITDDGLKESLEHPASLFVDHGGDTLDTTSPSETTDSRLGNALDVVSEDLSVTLSTTLAEAFATFATYKNIVSMVVLWSG